MSLSKDLTYFVSEKNRFLVVSLTGWISDSSLPTLQEIENIVGASQASLVVLNLNGVTAISPTTIPQLATLQQRIRKRPADLRLCGVAENLRHLLNRRGIIRLNELADNLEFALQSWQSARR
jgi:anti-anti-sigma regulatory factor